MVLPAHHHHCGLRICAWRLFECGTIDDAEPMDTKNLVIGSDHLSNLTSAMVMPYCDHSVFAELF